MRVNNEAMQNLKNLYLSDDRCTALLDAFSRRERCKHDTDVDYISELTHLKQSEVNVLFSDLERAGIGLYKKGNRWGKSRFEWFASPVIMAKNVKRQIFLETPHGEVVDAVKLQTCTVEKANEFYKMMMVFCLTQIVDGGSYS